MPIRLMGYVAAAALFACTPLGLPARTGSLEALKAYSEGQYAFAHGASAQAKALFQQAVQIDPAFASAYVGLSALFNNEHDFDRSKFGPAYDEERANANLAGLEYELVVCDQTKRFWWRHKRQERFWRLSFEGARLRGCPRDRDPLNPRTICV